MGQIKKKRRTYQLYFFYLTHFRGQDRYLSKKLRLLFMQWSFNKNFLTFIRDREHQLKNLLLGCTFTFRFLNSKVFRISVKKELLPPDHPGIISNHLHKEVKVGDVLNVSTFYFFQSNLLFPLISIK
mgnify:CR=1 FL=1